MRDAGCAVVALLQLLNASYVAVLLRYRLFGAPTPPDHVARRESAAPPGAAGQVVALRWKSPSRRRRSGLTSTEPPLGRRATPSRPIEPPVSNAAASAPSSSRHPRWAGWP